MDKSSIKLIWRYLGRFTEGPLFTRQKWTAFWRYAGSACSLISEKLMGVDYSMVYYTKDESIHHSVYTKVPDKVLKRVFSDVEGIGSKRFLDIGCGKGYAVTKAAQSGFLAAGGLEYSEHLYEICRSNLKKKGVPPEYVFRCDAKDFERYGDFDVFFMNNPFDETIIEPVAEKIYQTHLGRECRIYYVNPNPIERARAIERAGFKLVKQIPDPAEEYFLICVYSNQS